VTDVLIELLHVIANLWEVEARESGKLVTDVRCGCVGVNVRHANKYLKENDPSNMSLDGYYSVCNKGCDATGK
jgi:hypothetical protein